MIGRIFTVIAAVFALWITVIVFVAFFYGGTAGQNVARRLGESLRAESKLGSSSLSLVRGHLKITDLSVDKNDQGHLALTIPMIYCDLPPLGMALFDHECSDLHITGMRLDVSTMGVFQFRRPQQEPVHVGHVVIDDAILTFSPSAFLPDLGKIVIKIEHAEAAPTTFKTPLSWIFTMRELRAEIDLPANITLRLGYRDHILTAQGSLFGSTAVVLPVMMPVPLPTDDAHAEIKKLVAMGRDLAEQLVARRAQDWLKSNLSLP